MSYGNPEARRFRDELSMPLLYTSASGKKGEGLG